jgi:hypothetical protein
LTYQWSVKQNGGNVDIPANIRGNSISIPSYSLATGATYTFEVTVSDSATSLTTKNSASLFISPSALVATITPSSMQLLRAGKRLTLSGLSSYDPDDPNGDFDELSYLWICRGTVTNFCPMSFLSSRNASTYTVSADATAVNRTAVIQLFLSKGPYRNATVTVPIKIIEGNAPQITVQTTSTAVTSINTANSLLLSALIQSDYNVGCSWSVSPAGSVDLAKASLTSTSKQVAGQVPTLFNLYLAGNALAVRSTYSFLLTCFSSSTSIVVTTNGPPVGGLYEITPKEGIEMSSPFQYSTAQWSDPDLPITYLFGFISSSNGLLSTVQGRSTLTYATSTLPGGLASTGYGIRTIMRVFDSLNASAQLNITVKVTPLPAAEASSAITTQLAKAADSTNLDDIKAVISVASSVISRADCTGKILSCP